MKKSFLVATLNFIFVQFCLAQILPAPILPKGWDRIYIRNVGSFDLPPTMEIQAGLYKKFNDDIYKIMEYDAPQLVAQPKGINEFGKEGLGQYARVMIQTNIASIGDFERLNMNVAQYSQAEISDLNVVYKQQIQESFTGTDVKIIEWYPMKLEKVNGLSCIHGSFIRQIKDNPLVMVHQYMFGNNDRLHTLTLSYRLSEIANWESDFVTILKSFRITNIR